MLPRPLGPHGLAPGHPRAPVSERGLACRPHYVTPHGSPGWWIYSFHHLYSPPGFWSRALNLLPCQASWSVTLRLPLSSDISIRALSSGLCIRGGGLPAPDAAFSAGGPVLCRSLPSLHPARGSPWAPPPVAPPSVGRDAVGETRAFSSIPLNGGLSAPMRGRALGVGAGVHPWGTGRVDLGPRLHVWRAAGLGLDAGA